MCRMCIWMIYRKSMDFYRGKDCQELENELKEIMEQAQNNQDAPNGIWGHFQALTSKRFLRPFLCVGVIYTLFHLSGFNIISGTYTHIFLEVCDINRLRNPGYEFGEICVYELIASHLCRPM